MYGTCNLPALAIFTNTTGSAMGLPHVTVIVTTINAVGLLVAACIGVSQYTVVSRMQPPF